MNQQINNEFVGNREVFETNTNNTTEDEVVFSETEEEEEIDEIEAEKAFMRVIEQQEQINVVEVNNIVEVQAKRKREKKHLTKGKKEICTGCHREFFFQQANKEMRICFNCVKINDSVMTMVRN